MKTLVTGGTGFVGANLVHKLENPIILGRNPDRIRKMFKGVEAGKWNADGDLDPALFSGVDTVYHLAGESVFNERWTPEKKDRIMRSRVEGTRTLVNAFAKLEKRPATFICSSAVGFYGSRGDAILTEASAPGNDFLASVCQKWEEEAARAAQFGIRVVMLRTGLVLDQTGGALKQMLGPFKMGVGGHLGNGRQYMSWIHIDDLIGIMLHAAANPDIHGPVNAVSPNPVTNREFTAALGAALHRPAILPVPGFVLKAALGEFATVVLSSQRVIPDKLVQAGYHFLYPTLPDALKAAINR